MSNVEADSSLLFGILALKLDFIDRDELRAAVQDWVTDKSRPLAEVLEQRGALRASERELVTHLTRTHLKNHGDDPERSLAKTLHSSAGLLDVLGHIPDADLQATIDHVSDASTMAEVPDPSRVRDAPHPGATSPEVGRYQILGTHAQGGIGQVSLAFDRELKRAVALKDIQARFAEHPTSRARFLREAEITGGLEHPGIVPVYSLGHHPDGRPYYAMRFIRGESLSDAITHFHQAEGPHRDPTERSLALRQLLGRFLDVCNAIAYAHSRGVIHRDIKPANVMLGPFGETLVVDWGLAKAVGPGEAEASDGPPHDRWPSGGDSAVTHEGSTLGTPAFMSPEQAAGDLDRLGPASDIYSLGATLYCLLTGQAPFQEKDLTTVLNQVQQGIFPPPRQLDPQVDRALEAICLKAMARRPEDRYPSARALADDLEHWLADEPVSAYREPLGVRLDRWQRRHRTAVVATAALLLTAVVGLTIGTILLTQSHARTEAQRRQAETQRLRAEANFRQARQAVDDLLSQVGSSTLFDRPGLQPLRKELLESALTYYQEFLKQDTDDPSLQADLARAHIHVAEITAEIGSKAEAIAHYRRGIALFEAIAAAGEPKEDDLIGLGAAYTNLGKLQRDLGQFDDALAAFAKARAIRVKLVQDDPSNLNKLRSLAALYNEEGFLLASINRDEEAIRSLERAIAILEDVVSRQPDDSEARFVLSSALGRLGTELYMLGRHDDAIRSYREALVLLEPLAEEHPEVSNYQFNLAVNFDNLAHLIKTKGQIDQSIQYHENAQTIWRKLAEESPTVVDYQHSLAINHAQMATLFRDLGRSRQALESFQRALELWEGLVEEHPSAIDFLRNEAETRGHVGSLLIALGHSDEGLQALHDSVAKKRSLVRENPQVTLYRRDLASGLRELGKAQRLRGQWSEALTLGEEARELSLALVDEQPENPSFRNDLGRTLSELGETQRVLGQVSEALASGREALGLLRKTFQEQPHSLLYRRALGDGLRHRARAQFSANQPEAAAQTIAEWQALASDDPDQQYEAARELARGLAAIAAADPDSAEHRALLAERALEALQSAIQAGFDDGDRIREEPDFEPLRDHPDLAALIEACEKRRDGEDARAPEADDAPEVEGR